MFVAKIFRGGDYMTGGTCGENLTWTLNNGRLTISGVGDMSNYDSTNNAPWWSARNSIKTIVIEPGVTSIGTYAFYDLPRLVHVEILSSVTKIGGWAFKRCVRLRIVDIPVGVTQIGYSPFYECSALVSISYRAHSGFEYELCYGNKAKIVPKAQTPPKPKPALIVTPPAPKPKPNPPPAQVKQPPKPVPEKLRWKVEGKTLTVGGVREIKFYSYGDLPWVDSVDAIQHIVIEAGVEKISANAFAECKRLELLTIPASVKTIGDGAFAFCYCGNRAVNGGKNVLWSLDDRILTFKKNPDVRNATDLSIGAVSWRAVDKNITSVKIESGITPDKKFFDWRNGLSRNVPVSM